ncbi:MAG: HisA/HisF-related TIM barrel protein, partial [Actinomycetota bacterium]|nr:HisA/HisF-related TIM barrel protein [Actinomycetota bacterium]
MILYPAIDIADGKAVRLVQGDFGAQTVYADSPLQAAREWVDAGARYLHMVDLDGARLGSPQNLEHLER